MPENDFYTASHEAGAPKNVFWHTNHKVPIVVVETVQLVLSQN